jgi:acid phosphatase type 7
MFRISIPWPVLTRYFLQCKECQAAFEPLLLKYGVDLVLHGHKHFYERESAINNFTASEIDKSPSAPWYIVNGAAGHYDGKAIPHSSCHQTY